MKKIIFIVALALLGWMLYRTMGDKPKEDAKTEVPASTHPVHREEVTAGAKLNSVFPAGEGEFKVTFTQEKSGFAEADLFKDGKKLAAMTVSDTEATPTARDKLKASTYFEVPLNARVREGRPPDDGCSPSRIRLPTR